MISPGRRTSSLRLERVEPGLRRPRSDQVAVEEPMEIRLDFLRGDQREIRSVSVTMRTPGHDFDLAVGFLFCEGILGGKEDLQEISYCQGEEAQEFNVVTARLKDASSFDPDLLSRNFYMTSSCGVCGKGSLEAVAIRGSDPLPDGSLFLDPALVPRLPDLLLDSQTGFQRTGGLHAAGLFDADGELLAIREDVGRHNALDKLIGQALVKDQLPLTEGVLVVSGRTSFEIMQKALAAGIAVVVAVGAPSSLAVDVARRFNMTLIGFARGESFNVYSGGGRVMG
ncbi:formate dehydrogenase accessory sulfurtransferase FdhD, partial [Gemmatimonadota bacterium]